MMRPLIAVVDRDAAFLDLLDDLLGDEGFRTLRCATGAGARERIRAARPSPVILELWLERPDTGCRLLADLRRDPPTARTPVLICSTRVPLPAHQPIPSHWPAVAILQKPFELDDLLGQIRTLLRLQSPDGATESVGTEQSPAA
jgi:DNA-binding response OmpR family regulator